MSDSSISEAARSVAGRKIFFFLEHASVRGGIEIFAERQAAQLRAARATVVVSGTSPESFDDFDEVVVHKCSDVAQLEAFPPGKTTYYVHDHSPICPRSYAYTPLGHNCTRSGGLWPCIFCAPLCRNWRDAAKRVLVQRRRIEAMRCFAKIVVISNFMRSRLVANGIDAAKIEVKAPGVRGEVGFYPSAEHELARDTTIDVLFAGQLIRGKGVHLLLRAMSLLDDRRTLDIVGTGNMEPKLRRLAARLGLGQRVRFRGFQSDVASWMARAKCVVVPSFWQEPYGLVAAEAVALGRPTIAFAIGGLPEACGGKATLVPPGDIRALAASIAKTGL